jgi:hypothetical protein
MGPWGTTCSKSEPLRKRPHHYCIVRATSDGFTCIVGRPVANLDGETLSHMNLTRHTRSVELLVDMFRSVNT